MNKKLNRTSIGEFKGAASAGPISISVRVENTNGLAHLFAMEEKANIFNFKINCKYC